MKIIILLALLFTQLVHAELPAPVVAALKAEGVPINSVSVIVQQVDAAKPSITHNADVAMNPASVMKLVTSYAALDLLGPAYRWQTNFYATEPVENGVLNGGLWIKGSGDPSLNTAHLAEMISAMRQKYALQQICCDLMVDQSVYAPFAFDTGEFDGAPYRSYNAPAEALMVNQQAVRLQFILPSSTPNKQVGVISYPNWTGLQIKTAIQLTAKDCGDWKNQLNFKQESDTFIIGGHYSANCGEKYLDLSWMSGAAYFSSLFSSSLGDLQGSFKPLPMHLATVPTTATLLYQHTSPPLADVLRDMNKTSNNVMARAVYLALSAADNQAASTDKSEKIVKNWLATKQLHFDELVLENGAGLSRKERISAAHLGNLLVSAYNSPIMPELMASLPVLGVDGTLEKRKDNPASGRAHLKSGSLNNVRAIAGYVLDNQSRRWVVVFMANGEKAALTKPAQQALLDWLVTQP